MQVFPFRGFASFTSLYNAAELFRAKQEDEGKEVFVYYFGDHDPSGVAIDPAAVAALREDFGVEISFTRVAVTEAQITAYRLPTRPTKRTDSRAHDFRGRSVEIDAMPRDVLIDLVEGCITQHLPADALGRSPCDRSGPAGHAREVHRGVVGVVPEARGMTAPPLVALMPAFGLEGGELGALARGREVSRRPGRHVHGRGAAALRAVHGPHAPADGTTGRARVPPRHRSRRQSRWMASGRISGQTPSSNSSGYRCSDPYGSG